MASDVENSDYHPVAIASFFKNIHKPRLDRQRLEIPREFMINHGNDLSNFIYLSIQPEKVWKFQLVRENGRAILQKGWPEFVEFYSLDHGHFLMFHYHGNSQFEVIICDTSASEIMYPFDPLSCKEGSSKKRKPKHHLTQPTSSKRGKKMQMDEMVMDDKLIAAEIIGMSHLTPNETRRIGAYACECKHPSFVKKMQATFVELGLYMGVPKEFVEKFMGMERPFNFNYTFHLQTDDDGKKWPMKIVGEESSHVRLKFGWKKFASENKLEVGDICIFELINNQTFKVHILRVAAKHREKT